MTGTQDKLRAAFLAALMVLSMVAMTATFAGSAAADISNTEADSVDTVFVGERVNVTLNDDKTNDYGTNISAGQILQIRQGILGDGEGDRVATATVVNNTGGDQYALFESADTEGLAEDFHFFRVNGTNLQDTQFEVEEQDLDAEFENEINNNDNTETDLNVSSANWATERDTTFNVTVNSDSFDQDELLSIFENASSAGDGDAADPVELNVTDADNGTSLSADFADQDVAAGEEYEFDVNSVPTTGSDTATLSVNDFTPSDAQFTEGAFSGDRGDIIDITVDLDGTDTGTLRVGSNSTGYNATVDFQADSEGDQVTIQVNTYAIGSNASTVYSVAGDDDDQITSRNVVASGISAGPDDDIISAGSYDLEVNPDEQQETDIASLVINQRETGVSVNTWTAPASLAPGSSGEELSEASDIADRVGESVTESTQVAEEDLLISEVSVAGLEGALEHYGTVNNSDGDTEEFLELVNQSQIDMTFTQTNPSRNNSPIEFDITDLGPDDLTVIPDGEGTYYLVTEIVEFNDDYNTDRDLDNGMNIESEFTLSDDVNNSVQSFSFGLVPPDEDGEFNDETGSDSFGLVDRTASVDVEEVDGNDRVVVQPAAGQTITGDASVAPGTEISLRLQSQSGQPSQFVDAYTVTVDTDRSWTLETDDFDGRIAGTLFDVNVLSGFGVTETGLIAEPDPANFAVSDVAPADAEVEQGTLIDVSATVENTGAQSGTQNVTLEIAGSELGSQEVSLDAGGSQTVEFTDVDTSVLDEGDYTHTISSEDDSASGSLTINVPAPAEFVVSDLNPAEAEFEQGADPLSELAVSATITNEGELEGTQTVSLQLGGDELNTQDVTLAGGESVTVELRADASGLEPGDYTHAIVTDDDSAEGTLTITAPPAPAEFVVSELNPAEAEFEQGADALSELTVSATVTNDGELEGTQTVSLQVDGDELATQEVTLAGGDSQTAEITVNASGLAAGNYTHAIVTDDDSAEGTLTITQAMDGGDGEDGADGEDGGDGADGEDGGDGADGGDGGDGDDGSDDSGPGFGIVAALIAFIGAALLAVRRQN